MKNRPSITVVSTVLYGWLLLSATTATDAWAAVLVPHQAVYELTLIRKTGDLQDASGRIALRLERPDCDRIDLEYRYVAKFVRDDESPTTDQQTISKEDRTDGTYEFETKAFVDTLPYSIIRGKARTTATGTKVDIEEPEPASYDLPTSVFPSAHTAELIDRAAAGERFIQTRLYDGDNEAGRMLTTTAIVTDVKKEAVDPSDPASQLEGLRKWRVAESFYILGDDVPEGLPIFQSSYTLYENGVSTDLINDNGDYAFAGRLTKLDVSPPPACETTK